MPHGGARSGSGRPNGARTKKKRPDPVELAAEHGLTPLDYLLNLMRDETVSPERSDWAAKTGGLVLPSAAGVGRHAD